MIESEQIRYNQMIPKVKGDRILDIGCGDGSITKRFKGKEIVGIDLHLPKIIDIPPNCKFIEADARDLPFEDNHFDCVLMSESLEHIPDEEKAISEVHRVLRPGGRVIITVPNSTVLGIKEKRAPMDPDHKREYTSKTLRELLSKYFKVKKIEGVAFPLFEKYGLIYKIEQLPFVYKFLNVFTFIVPDLGVWILAIGEKK